jgi:hypothetical protein
VHYFIGLEADFALKNGLSDINTPCLTRLNQMCTHNLHTSCYQTKGITVVNITFTVDQQVAQSAREAAQKIGKSLDQVVLDYLEQLAGSAQRDQEWAQFEQSCRISDARLNGWKFNRDEANQR